MNTNDTVRLAEHDLFVLTANLPQQGLLAGDVGVVVHIYQNGAAYEAEFMALDGTTMAVTTVENSQVRPITSHDMTHVRSAKGIAV